MTVTAYVHERVVDRNPKKIEAPPPQIKPKTTRRRSLKDGNKVKSLFGKKADKGDPNEDGIPENESVIDDGDE